MVGYGSEEFERETISPLSLCDSRCSFWVRSFLGLQLKKLGM